MTRKNKPIRSDIAWSTPDRIEVHGKSLPDEILGHLNLGDMAFLQIVGRMPTQQESNVFNVIAVTLVEHGITPSALVARLTYAGAPESLQAAVAAGLCGLGSVFVGSTEGTAKMLYEALPPGTRDADLERIARETVAAYRERGQIIPGLGHPLHKPVDPREESLLPGQSLDLPEPKSHQDRHTDQRRDEFGRDHQQRVPVRRPLRKLPWTLALLHALWLT